MIMEEYTGPEDDEMNEIACHTGVDTNGNNNTNRNVKDSEKISDPDTPPASASNNALELTTIGERDNGCVLYSQQDDSIPTSCSNKDLEGNLLGSVVTMHNLTNCDDEYSPTLAICDIFNKPKDSPIKTDLTQSKHEENKDEFLIIDLDTCQMASKKTSESESKEEQSNSPSNDLVLVNLSSEEIHSEYMNNSNRDDNQNNFLLGAKDCDLQHHHQTNVKQKAKTENGKPLKSEVKEKISSETVEHKTTPQLKLSRTEIKRESCLQNKGVAFQDESMSDSILSKEMYSSDASFQSNDLNVSFHSPENQENESFYMPELYSRNYEEDKSSPHNSTLETDNGNQFYEYTLNDNTSFDSPLPTNLYNNSITHDFYDQQQTQNIHQYNFESKAIAMEKKSSYRHNENTKVHRYNKTNATGAPNKNSNYSTAQDHTSPSQFFHSSYMPPPYRTPYPYNSIQQTADVTPQLLSSSGSNYSDWNSWSNYPFYEVNLNTFPSVPNIESQCHQGKEEWCNDAIMPDLYQDPEMSIKSNQTEIDSEATEDADEIDDVPIFFEDSTDFSPCDNLSTMSVMSNSCYSDSSSVMTPMSPSDFTPPPSVSNTPASPVHGKNAADDQQCNYPFINENSRSEPIHLYSPTMLSATPYKLCNEKVEPNLMNYDRGQEIKRYYPSMADIHHSRSGFSVPPSKFNTNEMFEFPDYRKSNKNQIQSDKISTSTTKSACAKKSVNTANCTNQPLELYTEYMKQEDNDFRNESRRLRHNEPLRQTAIRIMSQWYEDHLDNPYPTKEDKMKMALDGGITVTQVKSWFANKRNRTNNTKPKVQKRAMKEKLKKLFQDLKHSRSNSLDNSHIIQQLSGIIQT